MSIERSPNKDKKRISFDDWDADMMVLASKLHVKPDPPGEVKVERNHELGIDRLAKVKGGKAAIDVMYDLVDDLPYRIDADAVLTMGKVVIKANLELEELLMARQKKVEMYDPSKRQRVRLAQTKHFVRDASLLWRRIVELIAEVREERTRFHTTKRQLMIWERQVRRLDRLLIGPPQPVVRAYLLMRWYRHHYADDIYIPHVDAASSLVSKFGRLEAAMQQRTRARSMVA